MKKLILLSILSLSSLSVMAACSYRGGATIDSIIEAASGGQENPYIETISKPVLKDMKKNSLESCKRASDRLRNMVYSEVPSAEKQNVDLGYFVYEEKGIQFVLSGKEVMGIIPSIK